MIQIPKNTRLFENINEEDLHSTLFCLQAKTYDYKKGDIIASPNERRKKIGLTLRGEIALSIENGSGNRTLMTKLQKGDAFGEAGAFSENETWPVTVESLNPSRVMFLEADKILNGCSKQCPGHVTLLRNTLKILAERTIILSKKIRYMSIKGLRSKLCTYLMAQNQTQDNCIKLPLSRTYLAEFLNVSRPALSRELGRMRDENLIEFHKNSIMIKDKQKIISFVE